jgi:predicted RNase H-like nuclease (RuvC/YqgF family)
MGLITDLLKESPLKAPQIESIALIEKRMQDEKLAAVREVERLKTEVEHLRTEMQQARSLVKVLEQEVAQWRNQARSRDDGPFDQPGADAGS